MKAKSVVTRELASSGVEDAIDYYLVEKAAQAALDSITSLEQAFTPSGAIPQLDRRDMLMN